MAVTPFGLSDSFTMEEFNNKINETNNTINNVMDSAIEGVFNTVNQNWIKLWEKDTAGSGTWVAPDLFDGKPYKVGVFLLGGGCSGIATYGQRSGDVLYGYGGASGCTSTWIQEVSPGAPYTYIVGAGGAKYDATPSGGTLWTSGNNSGGTSSMFGRTALGGSFASSEWFDTGGQLSIKQINVSSSEATVANPYGGVVVPVTINSTNYLVNKNPLMCYNPFENISILGCGGSGVVIRDNGSFRTAAAGKNPVTGAGGGVASAKYNEPAYGEDATESGCGGGGAAVGSNSGARTVISGAGADGAIKLYIRGYEG